MVGECSIMKHIVTFLIPLVQVSSCVLNNFLKPYDISLFGCPKENLLIHWSTD